MPRSQPTGRVRTEERRAPFRVLKTGGSPVRMDRMPRPGRLATSTEVPEQPSHAISEFPGGSRITAFASVCRAGDGAGNVISVAETKLAGGSTATTHVRAGNRTPQPVRRRSVRRLPFLGRSLIAVLGGVVIYLAFPPFGVWQLAPVGVGAVALGTYRQRARQGALLGFLAGIGFFLPLLLWIKAMLAGIGPAALLAWIGVAVLEAAFFALLGAGLALVTRIPAWPVWSAALWVAQELLRGSIPFGGFTWGRLAFSQGGSAFTPYASLGGAPFVTFLVALTGGLLAWCALAVWRLREVPSRRAVSLVAAGTIGVTVIPAFGHAFPLPSGGRTVTVAAVQGDVPGVGLAAFGHEKVVLDNHVAATRDLAAKVKSGRLPEPAFVIWPENASDLDPYTDPYARQAINGAAQDIGVPILVGALTDSLDRGFLRNLSIVWNPRSGPGETYLKRRLVPFGEYVPFRDLVTRFVDFYEQMRPRDIVPGDEPGKVTVAGIPVAVTICFDIAYDNVVREAVRAGGKLIVVQTNNASFGMTPQPEQQLAIERLRAVEHGRAVVVAATSGVSAVISPAGELIEVSEPLTRELLVEQVPLRSDITVADRLGAAPQWALAAIGALAVAISVQVSGRNRRRVE